MAGKVVALRPDRNKRSNQDIVRGEANVEELPFFSASNGRETGECVTWTRTHKEPATGREVEQSLTLSTTGKRTLPAGPECDLYILVLVPWLDENGFGPGGSIGPISYRWACERLGRAPGGRTYEQIRASLRRLTGMVIEFTDCVIDRETREFVEIEGESKWFDLRSVVAGTADDGRKVISRGEFTLVAADWYVQSWNKNYRKPLDSSVYRDLKGDIARLLYRYIDKLAWNNHVKRYKDEVREAIEGKGGLSERLRLRSRHPSKVRELIRKAQAEMVAKWPALHEASVQKVRPGHFEAVWRFNAQPRLAFAELEHENADDKEARELTQALIERKVSSSAAAKLVRKPTAAYRNMRRPEYRDAIRKHIRCFDEELRAGRVSKGKEGGWLRSRIVENWGLPPSLEDAEKRAAARERARNADVEKANRETEQERAYQARLESMSPFGRALHRYRIRRQLEHLKGGELNMDRKREIWAAVVAFESVESSSASGGGDRS